MKPEINNLNDNLLNYLKVQLDKARIDYRTPPVQIQGGFETHIYKFQLSGISGIFSKPLVLRLYPAQYGTGNAVWESTIQNVLAASGYPAAQAHLLCTDLSTIGGAFFIMDYLPGEPMVKAPLELVPDLLGKSHAALHRIDPNPLVKAIHEKGIDQRLLFLEHRYINLQNKADAYPWLHETIDWLVENRPPEPDQLAVCHGDFHPLNILVQDEQVTGVLDWPGFLIADPVLDIANTLVLSTIPFKHLASSLGMDVKSIDFECFAENYLDFYQAEKPFDRTNLDYYRIRRCANALVEGAQGQSVWRHPLILNDLLDYIHSVTGIQIIIPS